MLASIIIRTYNEERYLPELFSAIEKQTILKSEYEIIVVDSGSQDKTVSIAESFGAAVVRIDKKVFSFGKSLNDGCNAANVDVLVFISGHCIPVDGFWLERIIAPIQRGDVSYTYGKQEGRDTTKFSEYQVFRKYFPEKSMIPQSGYFCNNANAALKRCVWEKFHFDEKVTGLEDMCLARTLVESGQKIGYVSEAAVFHIHNESWHRVHIRYEREARALQKIIPEIKVTFFDFLTFFISSVFFDMVAAKREKKLLKEISNICKFRFMQYWGSYRGNHEHRLLSDKIKHTYFYSK